VKYQKDAASTVFSLPVIEAEVEKKDLCSRLNGWGC
jgi:hypothetical protein